MHLVVGVIFGHGAECLQVGFDEIFDEGGRLQLGDHHADRLEELLLDGVLLAEDEVARQVL